MANSNHKSTKKTLITTNLDDAKKAVSRNAHGIDNQNGKQILSKDLGKYIYSDEKAGQRKITIETLIDLKYAYLIGSNEREACTYAGITVAGYRYWLKNMPNDEDSEFMQLQWTELVKKWQDDVILQARKTIRDNLNDPLTAKWLLERKRREEYAVRIENDVRNVDKWEDVPDDTLNAMIDSVREEAEDDDTGSI